ncbi:MAG: GNAT family N-acetyltransferase [Candidatus Falkowbacteria bacterium]
MSSIAYKKFSKKFPAKKLKSFFDKSSPGKTLSQCQNIIDYSSVIIGAYDKSRLIGIGRSLDDKVYAFITDIIVNHDYRGQGIGSKIVKVLCGQLIKRKVKIIHCSTEKKLVSFYQSKVKFKYNPDDITLFLKNFSA